MLVLLVAMVLLFWMVMGAVQYVVCVAIAPVRRYALSAALWWVVWGPCSVALLLLAGLAALAAVTVKAPQGVSDFVAPIVAPLGRAYVVVGVVCTAVVATVLAWLHQAVVRRFPFALFRIYACLVSAGVGSVFGWCLNLWLAGSWIRHGGILGLLGMAVLVVGFGWAAYAEAGKLRGERAEVLPWVTREEFEAG